MITATWNGAVIARSARTVMVEGNHYFPAEDVSDDYLRSVEKTSVCPWKGTASYLDVVVDGKVNSAAAWTYREPKEKAAQIRDHIAFWGGVKVG